MFVITRGSPLRRRSLWRARWPPVSTSRWQGSSSTWRCRIIVEASTPDPGIPSQNHFFFAMAGKKHLKKVNLILFNEFEVWKMVISWIVHGKSLVQVGESWKWMGDFQDNQEKNAGDRAWFNHQIWNDIGMWRMILTSTHSQKQPVSFYMVLWGLVFWTLFERSRWPSAVSAWFFGLREPSQQAFCFWVVLSICPDGGNCS